MRRRALLAVRGFKPQLPHVGVLRAVERIGIRSAELWAKVGQKFRDREQRVLNRRLEGQEIRLEVIVELDSPPH